MHSIKTAPIKCDVVLALRIEQKYVSDGYKNKCLSCSKVFIIIMTWKT